MQKNIYYGIVLTLEVVALTVDDKQCCFDSRQPLIQSIYQLRRRKVKNIFYYDRKIIRRESIMIQGNNMMIDK